MKKQSRVGWREWVSLPGLGVPRIKAKLDTGARSSALHAWNVRRFKRGGISMVRFGIHPIQRDDRTSVEAEAVVLGERKVRSSSGQITLRIVVRTDLEMLGERWPIELTLARRDEMGFRLLLGRQALRGRVVIDPGTSYLGGK